MTLTEKSLSAELDALAGQAKALAREAAGNDELTGRTLAVAFVEIGRLSDKLAKIQKTLRRNGGNVH